MFSAKIIKNLKVKSSEKSALFSAKDLLCYIKSLTAGILIEHNLTQVFTEVTILRGQAKICISFILNFSHLLTDCILKINLNPISLLWVCVCTCLHMCSGTSVEVCLRTAGRSLSVHTAEVGCLSFLLLCRVLLAGFFHSLRILWDGGCTTAPEAAVWGPRWNPGGQAYIASASAPWALSQPWLLSLCCLHFLDFFFPVEI